MAGAGALLNILQCTEQPPRKGLAGPSGSRVEPIRSKERGDTGRQHVVSEPLQPAELFETCFCHCLPIMPQFPLLYNENNNTSYQNAKHDIVVRDICYETRDYPTSDLDLIFFLA